MARAIISPEHVKHIEKFQLVQLLIRARRIMNKKESDEIAGTMWLQCATSVILTRIECVAVRSCVSVSRNVATLCTRDSIPSMKKTPMKADLGHGTVLVSIPRL